MLVSKEIEKIGYNFDYDIKLDHFVHD